MDRLWDNELQCNAGQYQRLEHFIPFVIRKLLQKRTDAAAAMIN
jgi:hypothetical protein